MEEAIPGLEPEQRQPCVLVVEDEALIRLHISHELRDSGFSVVEAVSGDEALRVLQTGIAVDVVFTDVRMPGVVDGLDLAASVRKEFENTVVIVTSAHLTADAVSGMFIAKPYRPTHVVATIKQLLARDEEE